MNVPRELPKEIDYPCSQCGKSFKVPYEIADTTGNIVTCPYCGAQDKIGRPIGIKGTLKNLTDEVLNANKKNS